MEKIVFFHMNQLGDLLFSLPVLKATREEFSQAKISSVVRPELAQILISSGLVDNTFPRYKTNAFSRINLINDLRRENFSKGIFFSESPELLLIGYLSNIPERYGFSSASLGFLLTKKVARYGVPSLKNNRNLGLKLGLKNIPNDYTNLVNIPKEELMNIENWLNENKVNCEKMVIVSPGASRHRKQKCWQNIKWVKLLKLLSQNGLYPVIIGAPYERKELKAIADSLSPPGLTFFPNSGLLSLAALLKKAILLVSVDSGIMHLAASLGTKVVALFGPTDPLQVGPQPLDRHKIIKKEKMEQIEVKEVYDGIISALKENL